MYNLLKCSQATGDGHYIISNCCMYMYFSQCTCITTSNVCNTILTVLSNATSTIAISVSTLTSEHQRSYMENDVIILHVDTGRATVFVDKGDYDEKMNKILDDEKTYKELECDLV